MKKLKVKSVGMEELLFSLKSNTFQCCNRQQGMRLICTVMQVPGEGTTGFCVLGILESETALKEHWSHAGSMCKICWMTLASLEKKKKQAISSERCGKFVE